MYLNKKSKFISIISTVLLALTWMWLMPEPLGSFDPKTFGFWNSIFCAAIIGFSGDYIHFRFFKKYGTKHKHLRHKKGED